MPRSPSSQPLGPRHSCPPSRSAAGILTIASAIQRSELMRTRIALLKYAGTEIARRMARPRVARKDKVAEVLEVLEVLEE